MAATVRHDLTLPGEETGSSYNQESPILPWPRPRRHTSLDASQRPDFAYRPRSASNILDSTDDFHRRLLDPVLAPHLQRQPRGSQDELADLVDFLKNHSPPPSNFMSIPEDVAADERRRWLRWAKIAKRTKTAANKDPPQIRLPDTVVSGKTTGGHRHIAITIPLEAFPMGDTPRSQYPVYSHEAGTRKHYASPVRTIVNDKGIVTVLKTVNEDRASSMSSSRQALSTADTHSGSLARTPSSGQRQNIRGFFASSPSRESTPGAQRQGSPSDQEANSLYPTRMSSVGSRPLNQHVSIDGLLSQANSARAPASPPNLTTPERRKGQDVAGQTPGPLSQGKKVKIQPEPVAVNGTSTDSDSNDMLNAEGDSVPTTPDSSTSRKQRVRDRKRRDMEALKSSKQKVVSKDAVSGVPTLSPIHVVVNFEPDQDATAPSLPLTPSHTNSSNDDSSVASSDAFSGIPSSVKNVPTPPQSPERLLSKQNGSLDRTSLSRRREWRATREQERKARESRIAARRKAKGLATKPVDEGDDATQTLDREILRLYEAYRDHRFRDMERRVRRLERNGDVWLRALLPVLNTLNQNNSTSLCEDGNERAWMSDGEPSTGPRHKDTVPVRRAKSSHRTPREEELRHRADGWADALETTSQRDSMGSDEVSGMEAIEPLMRELAGAARARQMQKSEGLLHAH